MNQISKHYRKACQLAEREVIKRARRILRRHKNLDEFIIGMGSWFFTDRQDNILSPSYDSRAYFGPVESFIDKWDRHLKITGGPMRFRATGKIVRDW